ncbi:ATPase/histidine kinase/DNA gyrase B/HSP90 domain protein [Gleimia coleocanis DSM 15436]|uniref:histidine kinase n=1 Tax=Gleimia coleocanis DSM 15436 TaxID=525245 RepID=C0W1Y6_9ACTO|nr:ATPase/histidine kinase/DNA gyrase B/HSP90 domain protein [Gleimia coleocanis DSM 15436]
MSNLLSNALRHTPAGGQVRISVHRQGASTALIHVADDGEGIPPGQLGHIFERFYRGDAARSRDDGGAGIGLTISKALIEAHGGTLTAPPPDPVAERCLPSASRCPLPTVRRLLGDHALPRVRAVTSTP